MNPNVRDSSTNFIQCSSSSSSTTITTSCDIATYQQLKQMTTHMERKKFLDSFDVVFCDCDGVVWKTLGDVIPGSAEALDYLKRQKKQITFVTNNSIFSVEEHIKKFEQCKVKVTKKDIIHPAQTVADHLKSLKFDGLIYCLATPPFKQLLRDEGFQLAEEREGFVIKSLQDLRAAIYSKEPIKAVLIDVDFNMSAAKLMRAHLHLQSDSSCLFIAGAADSVIPFCGGNMIGPGPFIDIVAQSTKREATILGKPGHALRELLKARIAPITPQRVLFIGDSLSSDINFAKMCGYQTMLVLTGGTGINELKQLQANELPDYVTDCLADLNNLI